MLAYQLDHWQLARPGRDAVVLHYMSQADVAFDGRSTHVYQGAVAVWERRGSRWLAIARTEWKIAPDDFLRPNR